MFVPDCKHFCSKVGPFNMGVNGDPQPQVATGRTAVFGTFGFIYLSALDVAACALSFGTSVLNIWANRKCCHQ